MSSAAAIAGYPVARAALVSIKVRRADMNLLMTIAAVGALALAGLGRSEHADGPLRDRTCAPIGHDRPHTRRNQATHVDRTATARVFEMGKLKPIPVEEVAIDDIVDVLPGERIPIDGIVPEWHFSTGPVRNHRRVDSPPCRGRERRHFRAAVNGDGHLTIRATAPGTDTTVSRIIRLVEEAHQSKAPVQALVERFAAIYTPAVVIGAIALAFGGWFIPGTPIGSTGR